MCLILRRKNKIESVRFNNNRIRSVHTLFVNFIRIETLVILFQHIFH